MTREINRVLAWILLREFYEISHSQKYIDIR